MWHTWKSVAHLEECGTLGNCGTLGKMWHTWHSATYYEKCATLIKLRKTCETRKNGRELEKWVTIKKWVIFGKMRHIRKCTTPPTWKSAAHLGKCGAAHFFLVGSTFPNVVHFPKCGAFFQVAVLFKV